MSGGDSSRKAIISKTPVSIGSSQPQKWDRELFDEAIYDKGYNCYIERAMKCPCKVKATTQALTSCVNCGGSGWFYINKKQTKIVCTSMSSKNKYEVWTQENMGTVNITARAIDRLAFMDRITLTDLETIHAEVVTLRRSKSTGKMFSFTIYYPTTMYYIYLYQNDTEGLLYLNPSDYQIVGNKIVVNRIVSGIDLQNIENPTISILYLYNPTYYVIDINRDVIRQKGQTDCVTMEQHYANYPTNAIGRRCHYVLDNPDFSGDRLIDNTNYSIDPPNYDYTSTNS